MRKLGEPDRNDGGRQHCVAHVPEVGQRFLENLLVVESRNDDHLAMKLYSAFGETRELSLDVRHPRVVEQNLSRLVIRCMYGDVEWRQAVLENPRDVALLHVGKRCKVSVREGQQVIVVPDVEWFSQTSGKPFDETELAAVGAAANRGR